MKKILATVFAILVTFTLTSCATTIANTQPTITEISTAPKDIPKTEVTEGFSVPAYTGSPLVKVDPERKVYISLSNQDCDFFPNTFFAGINVTVLTTTHCNSNEISISIPMQTDYDYVISDISNECHQLSVNGSTAGFSNYHYLYLQNIDWQEIGQMAVDAMCASEQLVSCTPDSEKYRDLMEISNRYYELMSTYQNQYEMMSETDIPTMYAYSIDILFTGLHDPHAELYDETVSTVDFIIAGECYTLDIGEWRFHTDLPTELEQTHPGVKQSQVAILAITDSPYNGGFVRLPDALSFSAQKDISITGIRNIGSKVDILGGKVQISNSTSNVDYFWDLQQPLFIDSGSDVSIELYLKDDRFSNYEVNCTLYLLMDYEIDGKSYMMTLPCKLDRINNIWDSYFLALSGYDIGEYYTCFYVPQYENWINLLPNDWR